VAYYERWAKSGEPGAPVYRRISGVGSVEEISTRALAALA
jgi:adenylate kinase